MARVRKRQWTTPSGKRKVAWLVDFRDEHGRRRAKQYTSKAAAVEWADTTNLKSAARRSGTTFGDAAKAWLDRAEAEGLERSTITSYNWVVREYLKPGLGDRLLDELQVSDVVKFRKDLIARKSESLARRVVHHAKMVLRYAVDSRLTKNDFTRAIKVTKSSRHRKRPVIPERRELRQLLRFAEKVKGPHRFPLASKRDELMYAMMIETGIRPCEIRPLRRARVNLRKREIEILEDAKADDSIGACKTEASYRTIPISPVLARKLKHWFEICPRPADDFVFPTASGRIVGSRNFNVNFDRAERAAGITRPKLDHNGNALLSKRGRPILRGKYSPYALRHAAASWWIYQKVDLKRITTWIGHSSIQVTVDVYGHLIADAAGDHATTVDLATDLYGGAEEAGDVR